MRLNTFEEVEKHYNSIKPLVSKYHTLKDDVRPIGRRDRKWERIIKMSDDLYILADDYFGDARSHNAYSSAQVKRPPIKWERVGKSEFLEVRGSFTGSYDFSRYKFLKKYLPMGLQFDNQKIAGVHAVSIFSFASNTEKAQDYYIPRPKDVHDKNDYCLKFSRIKDLCSVSSKFPLMWKLESRPYDIPRARVNKEKKKELREELDYLWYWITGVGRMLPVDDYQWVTDQRTELGERVKKWKQDHPAHPQSRHHHSTYMLELPTSWAVSILKDRNHSLRTCIACDFLLTYNIKSVETEDDLRRYRQRYNRWANKKFGLMTTTTEQEN